MWHLKEPDINAMIVFNEGYFTKDECRSIVEAGVELGLKKNTNYFHCDPSIKDHTVPEYNENLRKSSTVNVPYGDERYFWIWRKCTSIIHDLNKTYEFDINYIESLEICCYDNEKDFYGPHHDVLFKSFGTRKITFSVQLSDDNDYQGGDLLVHLSSEPEILSRKIGTVNSFPSYVVHSVSPVTQGKRYALVGWVIGPKFK